MSDLALADYLAKSGPVLLLALFVSGLVRGWWVLGKHYEDVLRERDEWKQEALDLLKQARTAVDVAHTTRRKESP